MGRRQDRDKKKAEHQCRGDLAQFAGWHLLKRAPSALGGNEHRKGDDEGIAAEQHDDLPGLEDAICRERDENRKGEYLVGDRIHVSADGTGDAETAGKTAVTKITESGNNDHHRPPSRGHHGKDNGHRHSKQR